MSKFRELLNNMGDHIPDPPITLEKQVKLALDEIDNYNRKPLLIIRFSLLMLVIVGVVISVIFSKDTNYKDKDNSIVDEYSYSNSKTYSANDYNEVVNGSIFYNIYIPKNVYKTGDVIEVMFSFGHSFINESLTSNLDFLVKIDAVNFNILGNDQYYFNNIKSNEYIISKNENNIKYPKTVVFKIQISEENINLENIKIDFDLIVLPPLPVKSPIIISEDYSIVVENTNTGNIKLDYPSEK